MLTWKCLPLLASVLLCGCAQGFDRAALQDRLNDGTLQMPDADIADVRALRPQLRFPCRVAVYLKPSNDHDWRWTPEDKAVMEQWAAALKQDGIAADVFPLPEMLVGKGESKDLRLAAAKCGADALFVIHGAAQTDSYKNFAAALNLTIVGGYVVPGSHKDSLFLMEGVLIDVDNGYVYTGVQAEGVGRIVRPTFIIEEKDAVARAKAKAVAQFGDEVLARMRALAVAPVASDVPLVKPTPTRPFVSDANRQGATIGLTPAGTYAPDLDVPIRRAVPDAGGVMTGITAPRPLP